MSGQHVCATNNQANVYVEIEVIGVPADSFKDKTKVVWPRHLCFYKKTLSKYFSWYIF